jgi:hypothetical protein
VCTGTSRVEFSDEKIYILKKKEKKKKQNSFGRNQIELLITFWYSPKRKKENIFYIFEQSFEPPTIDAHVARRAHHILH